MIHRLYRIVLAALFVAVLIPAAADSQTFPFPVAAGQPPALCTQCPAPDTNLPTYQFSPPIVKHTGRYLDSTVVRSLQQPIRTYRAGTFRIAPERDRIYMQIGSTFAAYRLSTFFTQDLAQGMVSLNAGNRTVPEKYLPFYGFVYPESKSSGWETMNVDTQDRLGDYFDWDDRGYVYVPYTFFGWGVLSDNGGSFSLVKQVTDSGGLTPERAISFKHGSSYYVAIFGSGKAISFDVTNAAAPSQIKLLAADGSGFAKITVSGEHIFAYVHRKSGEIHIFRAIDFVNGGAPAKTIAPSSGKKFTAIDSDGSKFYAVEAAYGTPATIAVISGSSPASFAATRHATNGALNAQTIQYGSESVTISGFDGEKKAIRTFKLTPAGLDEIDYGNFLRMFYSGGISDGVDYASPGFCSTFSGAAHYRHEGREYLIVAANGLGDVFDIQGRDMVNIARNDTLGWGTPNPSSPRKGDGPFYGDTLRFSTTASSTTAVSVDFGNPEAAIGNVVTTTAPGNLAYRYSGITSASGIQSKRKVTVKDLADPTNASNVEVQMLVPQARVAIKNTAYLFTQPSASSTASIVSGDLFVDASDGSIESHYSIWNVGGSERIELPSAAVSVGACGTQSLSFTARYGAYGSGFASVSPSDFTATISPFVYSVRPFAAAARVLSSTPTTVTFQAVTRVGTSVPSSAPARFTWQLLSSSGAKLDEKVGSGTLATPAEYSIPASSLSPGNSVRLTVEVTDPSLITDSACTSMASSTATIQLDVPDPQLSVSGCTNAGGPCSVTVASSSGKSDAGWKYSWYLNGTKSGQTGKTFEPFATLDSEPNVPYTVKAEVTNETGIPASPVSTSFTLQPSLCSGPPQYVSFSWTGTSGCQGSACTSADTIQFTPSAFQYSFQPCDTFSWTFGDGGTSTEVQPTHKYASNGTYKARLVVSNSEGSAEPFETNVVLGTSGGGNPPPGGGNPPPGGGGGGDSCAAPSRIAPSFRGATSGCTAANGVSCRTGERIDFSVDPLSTTSFQSCDRFEWSFPDGSFSTGRTAAKTFSTAGTFTVAVRIYNTADLGGRTAEMSMTIASSGSGGGGNPSCQPPGGFVSVDYHGATSGCSSGGGAAGNCSLSEVITLTASAWQYNFQDCDTFEWDFGDGTPVQTTDTPTTTHQFVGALAQFTVNLTVKNAAGSKAAASLTIPFANTAVQKPTAVDFSASSTTVVVGTPVTFTGTATAPAEHPVNSWQWSFGDGVTSTGNPVQHTFSTEGTWNVTLTAANAGGAAPPVTKQIKVLKANAFAYLLPVVSHLDGANGSKWRTDIQIYNGNASEGPVELEFELTNAGMKKNFTLTTSTLIYEDFMSFFREDNSAGPVVVRGAATRDLQIWTRTYSVNASGIGTYGHLIPAVRIDGNQSFTAGETTLYLTGAAATEKYRTNLYLLNITPTAMPVTITAYEGQFGAAVGQFAKEVAPFQLTPISASEISGIPATKPFSLAIQGTSDGLIAYESVVDNGSNDPIYIPAISTTDLADATMRNQVLPSVGHAGLWKSDVTIFNPDDQAVQFDLAFYKDQTGELLAEAKDQILPAKGLVQIDDIIWSHAMVPQITTDAIGTLRVNVDSPLADQFPVVSQRNYSDSGNTRRFGQGVLGFSASKPNVSAGKPAILPAVRSDQLYRSNVGLVNIGTTDATVMISLLDQNSGQTIGIHSLSLKPNESRILPDMIRFLHETADRGSIRVEVTNEASVWAFATIIDKSTSDPEYVPAIPLN